jgi:peptidoglycan/LPS O-acetylase OafA/YrhL
MQVAGHNGGRPHEFNLNEYVRGGAIWRNDSSRRKKDMGFYRLILAVLVVISHVDVRLHGYNPGVVAVISFFILSGYVMSILIGRHYKQPSAIPTFYLDRIARLFPQFLFYMALASVGIYFFKIDSPFINELTLAKWLLNFLMLPQGFYMLWADGALVIPQSWSLGLELSFYLVIPWIIIFLSKRQIYGLAGASALVFIAAYLGKIHSDFFGYRLLPGTLFMFLVGWSFFESDNSARKFRIFVFAAATTLLTFAYLNPSLYARPYNKEVLLGLLAGIVAVSFIRRFTFSDMDEFFGNLSYGVFLNHFIVIWMMQKFFAVTRFDISNVSILLTCSLILSWGSYLYVERPALRWRHSIRNAKNKRDTAGETSLLKPH